MWIFTNRGFLSAVQHLDRPGYLLVRARFRDDLEAILGDVEVFETPEADYRFRCEIPQTEFAEIMRQQMLRIDYPNFKNSIPSHKHFFHSVCSSVWATLYAAQHKAEE